MLCPGQFILVESVNNYTPNPNKRLRLAEIDRLIFFCSIVKELCRLSCHLQKKTLEENKPVEKIRRRLSIF